MNFLSLTSVTGETLIVNMNMIISVQASVFPIWSKPPLEQRKVCVLTKLDHSSFEVTETLEEIQRLLNERHGR